MENTQNEEKTSKVEKTTQKNEVKEKTDKNLNLFQKIIEITNEIKIKKSGKNTHAKFSYFTPEDVYNAINPLLKKYGLFIKFDLIKSKEQDLYNSTAEVFDLNSEREDKSLVYKFDIPQTQVHGASAGQNAGATLTYAKRYMLMNIFNIADNESDLDSKDQKTFIQKNKIKEETEIAIQEKMEYLELTDEQKKKTFKIYGVYRAGDLSEEKAQKLIKLLNDKITKKENE